ncbi:hypothetical protein K7X08_021456 [Anisodus acutangulus]|uniref:Uncharacterized protein n=1 Tax=Anisodus acutangulus TaxID=402998 RepID=A0A9Q1RDV5_9SOLA|nr:hypothetical protein K7X08_021456 [Anisodus acutangulus]
MTSSGKEDQDQRNINGIEDSNTTIEFLRGRLLAERSASRTAKQRADELAQRVSELEEQLKVVSLQRKKAEKATAAVLSILENHAVDDVSEEFSSGSDQETILSDSKVSENKTDRGEISSSAKEKEDDADTFSSSEIASSPSTARSLSWKSDKGSLHSLDRRKYTDSNRRRCSKFTSTGISSPKRGAKSCRRIRRRDTRSASDDLQNSSAECASEALPSSANNGPQSLTDGAGNGDANDQVDVSASGVSGNGRQADKNDEDMQRALHQQAQLIGQYEDMQRSSNVVCLDDKKGSRTVRSDSTASEFTRSMSNGNYLESHSQKFACSHHQSFPVTCSPMHPQVHTTSCSGASSLQTGQALQTGYELALVSHNTSNGIGSVLGELEQAKLSLNKQINSSLPLIAGSSIKAMEYPVFPSRFSSANYSPEPSTCEISASPYVDSRSNYVTRSNRFTSASPRTFPEVFSSVPSYRPISVTTLDAELPSPMRFNPNSSSRLPFSSKFTYPTYPEYPGMVPKLSSGEVFSRNFPTNEAGLPPSFSFSTLFPEVVPKLPSGEVFSKNLTMNDQTGMYSN